MPGERDLVELTRRSMQQSNERDFDAAVAVFAEDAAFDVSEAGLGRFEGRDAVRSYLEDWVGSYERQEFTAGTGPTWAAASCSWPHLRGRPAGTQATCGNAGRSPCAGTTA